MADHHFIRFLKWIGVPQAAILAAAYVATDAFSAGLFRVFYTIYGLEVVVYGGIVLFLCLRSSDAAAGSETSATSEAGTPDDELREARAGADHQRRGEQAQSHGEEKRLRDLLRQNIGGSTEADQEQPELAAVLQHHG